MKNKVLQEIKNKEIVELRKAINETKAEIAHLRLDHAQFKLKNTSSLSHKKKEVAVMQTVLTEKEAAKNEKNA
ncbi:MAG: Ribosomal protein [Patescibacteria group bacterium]|jgi:ribosomal protein L29|nr:Ribosomal protein [Patescibacteria group bacterium]